MARNTKGLTREQKGDDKEKMAKKSRGYSAKYRESFEHLRIDVEIYESKLREAGIALPPGGRSASPPKSTSRGTRYHPDNAETMSKEELSTWRTEQRLERNRKRMANRTKIRKAMEERLSTLEELFLSYRIGEIGGLDREIRKAMAERISTFEELLLSYQIGGIGGQGRGCDDDNLMINMNISTQTTEESVEMNGDAGDNDEVTRLDEVVVEGLGELDDSLVIMHTFFDNLANGAPNYER